jgi:hypothetical protein
LNNFDEIEKAYGELYSYCEAERFAGWDPFDGLNSLYFQATPLRFLAPARLFFLQIVKRSARNLRPMLRIEKGVNAKGIALFALAELARFRATRDPRHESNAKNFLDQLLDLRIPGQQGATQTPKSSWGYNFDWQSRAFFAPIGTPTIVPTAFAAQAFAEAHELFGDARYVQTVREVSVFIKSDLYRTAADDSEVCFSYTPLDKTVIYNASLLAAEILAIAGDADDLDLAAKAARFVIVRQRDDGAWTYGEKRRHAWVDNFHTAFILVSLNRLNKRIAGLDCSDTIRRGLDFWLANHFLDDGTPKYFDRETYPVDIHSASAAIVALCELSEVDARCRPLASKIASWLNVNMRDESGYYHYQKRRSTTVKTPFVRWSNAWTAYALAKLLERGP